MTERQPYHPPIPEPGRAPHEGGNGAPGLPRTVHESAKPPPPESRAYPTLPQKSALNRAVERTRELYESNGWIFIPLGEAGKGSPVLPNLHPEQLPQPASEANIPPSSHEFHSWQEPQNQDKLSDRGREKLVRGLAHRSEDETMPKVTSANVEQFLQRLEKLANAQDEETSSEQKRQEVEASIAKLKQLRTMSQRIGYAVAINLEHLHKLWQHDPEFMRPILTGLVKRRDRIEKKERLFYRITEGDMSPARKPDYDLLHDKVAQWHKYYPADYKDFLKKTSPKERNRMGPAEIDLFISTVGIGEEGKSELAGVQNALVCAHDLIQAYQEVGVAPPKPLRQLYRRLVKRRAYLDPNYDKDSHL